MPRCASASTSRLTAVRTCAASDFPSRMRAAMGRRSLALRRFSGYDCRAPRSKKTSDPPPMSAVPQFPAANDPDALETQEWLDALEAVLEREGPERAHFLLERLIDKARPPGAYIPFSPNTPY